jgi:hypothetical protein
VQIIFLADFNRLLELFVLSVKKGCDASAFQKFVFFKTGCKRKGFKAIVLFYGTAERLKVLIFKVDFVESFIYCTNVLGLDAL